MRVGKPANEVVPVPEDGSVPVPLTDAAEVTAVPVGTPAKAARAPKPRGSRTRKAPVAAGSPAVSAASAEADTDTEGMKADEPTPDELDEIDSAVAEPRGTEEDDRVGTDSVRRYFNQVGRVPLLAAIQEVELAKRIEVGLAANDFLSEAEDHDTVLDEELRGDLATLIREGRAAQHHLVEANLRLVISIAKRYTGRGMAFQDLIQEGNLGLIHATEKFDYMKGYKFSTYATWWVRQSITRAMAEQARTIRLPVHMVETVNRLDRTRRNLTADLGRDPTPEEIAEAMDITPDKVVEVIGWSRTPLSLSQPVGDGEATLGDFVGDTQVAPAETVTLGSLRDALESIMDTLPPREAGILRWRFGLVDGKTHTYDEIGRIYNLTRERIRQIEINVMRRLRRPAITDALEDYRTE